MLKSILLNFFQNSLEWLFNLFKKYRFELLRMSNAFTVSSFLLVCYKLCFGGLPFVLNLSILCVLTFYSYTFFWNVYAKHFILNFLKIIMPQSIQEYRDALWGQLILEAEEFPRKKKEFEDLQRISPIHFFVLHLYICLIWFRLFILHKPYLYLISYFILLFVLLVNNQPYILLIYSFLLLLSKLCFFISCDSSTEYKGCMQNFCSKDLFSDNISIQPSFLNAMVFSYFNLSLLVDHCYGFFGLKNQLDVPFIFILICDHFLLLGWRLPLEQKNIEINIKEIIKP